MKSKIITKKIELELKYPCLMESKTDILLMSCKSQGVVVYTKTAYEQSTDKKYDWKQGLRLFKGQIVLEN